VAGVQKWLKHKLVEMSRTKHIVYRMSEFNRGWASLLTKLLLLFLTALYGVAALAAFAVVNAGAEESLRRQLVSHGLQHAITAFLCAIAFVLVVLKNRFSGIATGLALVVVGTFAITALANASVGGLHFYHLIEYVIVLPSVAFISWQLLRPSNREGNTSEK